MCRGDRRDELWAGCGTVGAGLFDVDSMVVGERQEMSVAVTRGVLCYIHGQTPGQVSHTRAGAGPQPGVPFSRSWRSLLPGAEKPSIGLRSPFGEGETRDWLE